MPTRGPTDSWPLQWCSCAKQAFPDIHQCQLSRIFGCCYSYRMISNAKPSAVAARCSANAPAARPRVTAQAGILSAFTSAASTTKAKQREAAKEALLSSLEGLARGVNATDEQKAEVERLASALEKLNPTPKPLESEYLSGRWRLLYTTSSSILAETRPPFLRPQGPIYQTIGRSSR